MAEIQFITFKLNGDLYGLRIERVKEIHENMEITEVDGAPHYVKGLQNLRGQIVTLLDLKAKLKIASEGIGGCCIITKPDQTLMETDEEKELAKEQTGLLVDEIGDVITVGDEEVAAPPANTREIDGAYLSGVVRLENELVVILDVNRVIKPEREEQAA